MPRPLKRPEQPIDPYKAQPLPLGRPAAVYYRQSSEGQIGNIMTTLQTIDMIEHLLHQGYVRENVVMIMPMLPSAERRKFVSAKACRSFTT